MENCIKGDHKLVEIFSARHPWDESYETVRWCSNCGAVVIDVDFDGRVNPGGTMKMKFPKITKDYHEEFGNKK